MNRAGIASLTLFVLAFVVAVFVASWLTIPSGERETHNLATAEWENRLTYPAKLFRVGLRERQETPEAVLLTVELDDVKKRVIVFFGGVAAVVVLVGGAFAVRASPY